MNTHEKKPQSWRTVLIVIGGLAVAIVFAFFFGANAPDSRSGDNVIRRFGSKQTISATEFEERYGLRITLIGVTAGGGLVDLRFKVVDAEKANLLLKDHKNMPALIPAGSKVRLGLPSRHSTDYVTGKVYYMLYGNANGVVQPGKPVSVAFGDLVLEPINAQ
jgi:hypothetical protein